MQDTILNPLTGRYIKRTGRLGKLIQAIQDNTSKHAHTVPTSRHDIRNVYTPRMRASMNKIYVDIKAKYPDSWLDTEALVFLTSNGYAKDAIVKIIDLAYKFSVWGRKDSQLRISLKDVQKAAHTLENDKFVSTMERLDQQRVKWLYHNLSSSSS